MLLIKFIVSLQTIVPIVFEIISIFLIKFVILIIILSFI